jgi:Trypsin-like peptidase domain
MSPSRSFAVAGFSLVCLSVCATAIATAAPAIQDITPQAKDNPARPIVTAILMDRDRRGHPDDGTRVRFGATGLVRCGNMIGTAQLVLRHDVIVTAAHVLSGAGGGGECVFVPGMGRGEPVPIATSTIRLGSRAPLSEAATRDWAVARLAQPVSAATPYGLATLGAHPGTITLCAGGNGAPTRFGTETCAVRGVIKSSADGIRELAIDCSASPGSSGAALLSGGAIAGIYVGYRSTNPEEAQAFSKTHYNFGITIDGPFRHALQAAVH